MFSFKYMTHFIMCLLLPTLIFGTSNFFELEIGAKQLLWFPDQPARAKITTTGYTGLTLNGKLHIKNIIKLYTFKYEFSNGIEPPAQVSRSKLIKEKTGNTGYVVFNLLSDIFNVDKLYNASLVLRANYEDYRSCVEFDGYIRYIPYDFSENKIIYYYNSNDKADFYTRFYDTFTGISFGDKPDSKNYGRFYVGMGKTVYQKPHSFRVGDRILEDTITDTRFSGYFGSVGFLAQFVIPSDGIMKLSGFFNLGSGEMELVKGRISISEIAENNNSDIYYQAIDITANYKKLFLGEKILAGSEINFGIKSFELMTPEDDSLEDAANLNQDYFLSANIFIEIRL